NGSTLRVVLDNLQDPATAHERPVTLKLGSKFTRGDFIRLTGPALDATTGITLGGHTVDGNGGFPPLSPAAVEISGDTLNLTLPPGSATLLTFRQSTVSRQSRNVLFPAK
ncbi:MAG TPA: glycosyl hydrolase family 79 C-terminal domain-containing protein, partial [Candidatus Acidoferrum sp.]|nr:glycosyl hydrolase family 79 C-terminal domain-containing protein [Candidatus Acidoferrum sp.]